MDEKLVKPFKMKKLNERLLTAPNGAIRSKSLNAKIKEKGDKKPQKEPQKIKDLLNMMKEPPSFNLEIGKINQMCDAYPDYMNAQFNRNSEIRGGTNQLSYEEHLQQLKTDSYDDMKIPIEPVQEQIQNNQFNYLYANMPPPSNKLFQFLNRRSTASTVNPDSQSSRRRCYTPNMISARTTARSPEDTLQQTKNSNRQFNVQFYESYNNNTSILEACKQRGEVLKSRELNRSSRQDSFRQSRASSAFDNVNESYYQKTQNSFNVTRQSAATPEAFQRRNISSSQSKRLEGLRFDGSKSRLNETNTSFTSAAAHKRAQTVQGDIGCSPRNKKKDIREQEAYQSRFITEPIDLQVQPHTVTNFQNRTQEDIDGDQKQNFMNMSNNNNFFSNPNATGMQNKINDYNNENCIPGEMPYIPPYNNLKKKQKQEIAEWRYIEFVHKRKSLWLTPDCSKVNQIIRKQQQSQMPKNCSLNTQIERSQLQRYYDQYLITSKPATPTKIKDIRQRLAVSKEILRQQGLISDNSRNPVKQKISEILQKSAVDFQSSSEPTIVNHENFDDPTFFLKNRLSPSKINYKEKNVNIEDMVEDAIPEVQDEDNYVEKTPKRYNESSPQMQKEQKAIQKLEQTQECTSEEEDEEDLQIYRENSDDDYDDDDIEDKQKKLAVLKERKARRSKDLKFWEKSAKEQFVKSPDNDMKSYLKMTASSQKQNRIQLAEDDDLAEGNQRRSQSVQKTAFAQVNTILNACHKVTRQNKIDNKLFKKAHNTVNKNIQKYQQFLPKGEEEEENFEDDIKDIIRDEKLHDFLQKQMILDYEDSLLQVQAARTQNQQTNDLSRPKELITYVKNNILDSVIRNPAFYNHLLTDTRKKKLMEDKNKIKSYVNQQDKDMSKLVRYSDFISFK